MIALKNISLSFGKKEVLKDLSAQWADAQIHGLVGHNGSGKSTLFQILAGYIKPDSGQMEWQDQDWDYEQIGFVETQNFFYSRITGQDYLNLFPQTNVKFDLQAFQAFFQLPLQELIEYYSTGMKKKLALLAMLKQEKQLLLLDEPFNGLDLETNKVLEVSLNLLKSKGRTIVLSSHVLGPLLEICDQIHYLNQGKIQHSYGRKQFGEIDQLLFAQLKAEAAAGLQNAL